MLSLETVTRADFESRMNETFRLALADGTLPLLLVEVKAAGAAEPGAKREPFSIAFRASGEIRLPQGIYRLENEQLGTMEIFLVQHGPLEVGAVFS
jgi:hypothetical protein